MEDHKPRSNTRSGSFGSTVFGIFVGLLLGLLIAAAIAVYMMRSPLPFIGGKPKPASGVAAVAKADPAPRTDGAADKSSDSAKPRFEFYKILPGKEDAVPDRVAKPAARDPVRPEPQASAPSTPQAGNPTGTQAGNQQANYMIQAGSFQNPADADNMKAKLALLGMLSNVEPTPLPDKGTWYRVRLGPYTSLGEINHIRSQLAQNGIDATLIKLKAE